MNRVFTILEPLPVLTRMNGLWLLEGSVVYDLGRKNSGLRITIPQGYASDLASIHWLLRPVLPRRGKFDAPALLHDWLYNTHLVSRAVADAVFLEAMNVCQVPRWQALTMYLAVRCFGGRAYWRGPDALRVRAPEWAAHIFDEPALICREKETL